VDPIQIISAIGMIAAVIISAVAILQSTKTTRMTVENSAYHHLDDQMIAVYDLAVRYPQLRDESKTRKYETAFDSEDKIRYMAYANMVWNVCEAIYDKMLIIDNYNRRTWETVIRAENHYHRQWLKIHNDGFKEEFLIFMQIKFPNPSIDTKIPPLKIDSADM
jgi:hypothetical protein